MIHPNLIITTQTITMIANFKTMEEYLNVNGHPFLDWIKFLKSEAKNHLKVDLEISEHDIIPIKSLLVYFDKDVEISNKMGIDLQKGIALLGPIGCGKTTLMRLFSRILTEEKNDSFIVKPTREIITEFDEAGRLIIQKYSKDLQLNGQRNYYTSLNYCFDDLGIENTLNHFGKKINVMEEILTARYDIKHIKTHFTSNINSAELKEKYGPRLASRMRQMFNTINFQINIKDKRK